MIKRVRVSLAVMVVFMGMIQASVLAEELPRIPHGWSSEYVYANGIRINSYHARPAPGRPVIVMVHGITDNGLCWANVALKLQDEYDIYMVDTRGHGLSDPFTAADDGDTLIKDLVEFVQAKNFDRKPILMGHSMGAATVMRVGAEYPELARAIIMLDPLLGRRVTGGGGNSSERPQHRRQEAAEPKARPVPEPGSRVTNSMMGSPEQLVAQNNQSYEALLEHCKRSNRKWDDLDCQYWALSKKQYHGAYSGEQFGVMSGVMQIGNSLAEIPVPAIILKADTSEEGRAANLEAASVMQKGALVHIDDAAHNLHHDQLDRTMEVISEFLSTL